MKALMDLVKVDERRARCDVGLMLKGENARVCV
jgi:hypothetical protein